MEVVLWLAAVPMWLSALLVIVVPTVLAMLGPVLIRQFVVLERLTTNNEVAGFKFAVVGVVYAVLLGFAVIVVWEKFHDGEVAVMQEAGAALNLYRLSGGLAQASQQQETLRRNLATYLEAAASNDWKAMSSGQLSPDVTHDLNHLYEVVLAVHPVDAGAAALQTEMLTQLDQLTGARRARLVLAEGSVPGVVWVALGVGAIVTVCFTFFFGTINLRAQTLMTGLLALAVFTGLEVILTVNQPFTGPVRVTPEPLHLVLAEFAHPI